ncbi:Unannotated [Lentimonas sp. CC19]|nr:Unannotated [Lentimonas sp. CC19]CAA6693291.1 Unannotated [Lentimonas sp. CC10]CAA7071780.1 Unannotated [Lentimonas sp. CC11]
MSLFQIEIIRKKLTTLSVTVGRAMNQVPSLRLRLGASDFTFNCKDPVYGSACLLWPPIVTYFNGN